LDFFWCPFGLVDVFVAARENQSAELDELNDRRGLRHVGVVIPALVREVGLQAVCAGVVVKENGAFSFRYGNGFLCLSMIKGVLSYLLSPVKTAECPLKWPR
jgi:hypothetical protein